MMMAIGIIGSVVLVLGCGVFLGLAPMRREEEAVARPESVRVPVESAFFAQRAVPAPVVQVPVELLLSQIERHVRLEQAAVETFVEIPTMQNLHARTAASHLAN